MANTREAEDLLKRADAMLKQLIGMEKEHVDDHPEKFYAMLLMTVCEGYKLIMNEAFPDYKSGEVFDIIRQRGGEKATGQYIFLALIGSLAEEYNLEKMKPSVFLDLMLDELIEMRPKGQDNGTDA